MKFSNAIGLALILSTVGLSFGAEGADYPEWDGYPPMNSIRDVVEFNGKVFCATPGGLFRYDPETKEYTFYYKNHGLVSNDILCLGATSKELYIGFKEDGLWRMDADSGAMERILFPEYHMKTSANPTGMAINVICAKNDSVLYIGHANGIDKLNVVTEELKTYTQLGPKMSENKPVDYIYLSNGRIWACTSAGVAVADESDPNLEFPEKWKNYIYSYQNKVYGMTSVVYVGGDYDDYYFGSTTNGIYTLDKTKDEIVPSASDLLPIEDIVESNGGYYAATSAGLYSKQSRLWWLEDKNYLAITALAPGSEGRLWVGTMYNGLQCYRNKSYQSIPMPSGMNNMTFYDITIGSDGALWAATSYRDVTANATFQRLKNGIWSNYNHSIFPNTSLVSSAIVDTKGLVWLTLWGNGIYVLQDDGTPAVENDLITLVDEEHLIFRPSIEKYRVYGSESALDRHGNIWIANYQADPPDHKIEPIPTSGPVVVDGYPITRYQNYSPAEDGLPSSLIFSMATDPDDWLWYGTYNKGVVGIFVGEDPFDKSDTVVKQLTMTDSILSMRVDALACDKDGFVWVGSQGGLNRIEKKPGKVLGVEVMNNLLSADLRVISAIEVDRFNNKWIGTTGGLAKIGPDNTLIAEYKTSNSGLFSNAILSLAFDPATDILWVGTDVGLNKLDTTSGGESGGDADIHVYPNPFEIWGYDSRATFTGLKANTTVKLYTFNGERVNEIPASSGNGGYSAVWDGRNFEGNHVGSGIYFFTGIDSRGRTFKDKMAVIRR